MIMTKVVAEREAREAKEAARRKREEARRERMNRFIVCDAVTAEVWLNPRYVERWEHIRKAIDTKAAPTDQTWAGVVFLYETDGGAPVRLRISERATESMIAQAQETTDSFTISEVDGRTVSIPREDIILMEFPFIQNDGTHSGGLLRRHSVSTLEQQTEMRR